MTAWIQFIAALLFAPVAWLIAEAIANARTLPLSNQPRASEQDEEAVASVNHDRSV